ncbi:hypothetical protein GM547_14400, partial [Streptococcus pneumoniae]|nr:hypothetical protein [Streptococcus pneumoniae]
NQVLRKNSSTNYDTSWVDPPTGSGPSAPLSKDLTYNVQGRLSTVVSSAGTKTLTYDVNGRLEAVSDTNGNILKTMVYDV